MIELDVADLVVIAGQVLGIRTDAALSQLDVAAAEAALTEARVAGRELAKVSARPRPPGGAGASAAGAPHRAAAAANAAALLHALLRHPLVPNHGQEVAVAAGLQFLAVNGWQADLDVPEAAVIIIERLASGQLTPADTASWLTPRLSPHPASPARPAPARTWPRRGSGARHVLLAPVAAVRHRRHRRSGPGPFVISLGSADKAAGIRTPATGLMPFTGHARDSVVLSGEEARRRGQARSPEHMLLGLIGAGDGMAVKALERLGIPREAVREQVEQSTGTGQPQAFPGQGPETPQARRMWHATLDEAVAHGHDYIGTEHFLLALFSDSGSAAARALAGLGAGENEVRGAIAALLAESGPERSA